MRVHRRRVVALLCGALLPCLPALVAAQLWVYPERGQSQPQQDFDRGQCYSWAVQQTGFDPANPRVAIGPPPPPAYRGPDGSILRGAAGGAALGAVGGAIGGDAGKGAAIGAGVGALFGGMRRMRELDEQQQMQANYQAQQQGALAHGRSNYDRAFAACMSGRGYTVR
jgi:Glycine zipper